MSQDADREELALDALFGTPDQRRRARALLERTPAGKQTLFTIEHGLARAADELRDATGTTPRQTARLVAGVLARTTRQDLSWRGDLHLAWEFLRARLRASPALRLVAACLVLHLVAGPVVAYWIFHRSPEPSRGLTLRVERALDSPFASEPPGAVLADSEFVTSARLREERENARARERFLLQMRGPSAPTGALAPDAPLELRLLAKRGHFLRGPVLSLDGANEFKPGAESGALALVLWVEFQLDRLVLTGRAAPELGIAAQELARLASDGALPATAPDCARLAAAAVARARSQGVVEDSPAQSSPPDPAARLLSQEWFEAFEGAGRETDLAEESLWRDWLAWGRE